MKKIKFKKYVVICLYASCLMPALGMNDCDQLRSLSIKLNELAAAMQGVSNFSSDDLIDSEFSLNVPILMDLITSSQQALASHKGQTCSDAIDKILTYIDPTYENREELLSDFMSSYDDEDNISTAKSEGILESQKYTQQQQQQQQNEDGSQNKMNKDPYSYAIPDDDEKDPILDLAYVERKNALNQKRIENKERLRQEKLIDDQNNNGEKKSLNRPLPYVNTRNKMFNQELMKINTDLLSITKSKQELDDIYKNERDENTKQLEEKRRELEINDPDFFNFKKAHKLLSEEDLANYRAQKAERKIIKDKANQQNDEKKTTDKLKNTQKESVQHKQDLQNKGIAHNRSKARLGILEKSYTAIKKVTAKIADKSKEDLLNQLKSNIEQLKAGIELYDIINDKQPLGDIYKNKSHENAKRLEEKRSKAVTSDTDLSKAKSDISNNIDIKIKEANTKLAQETSSARGDINQKISEVSRITNEGIPKQNSYSNLDETSNIPKFEIKNYDNIDKTQKDLAKIISDGMTMIDGVQLFGPDLADPALRAKFASTKETLKKVLQDELANFLSNIQKNPSLDIAKEAKRIEEVMWDGVNNLLGISNAGSVADQNQTRNDLPTITEETENLKYGNQNNSALKTGNENKASSTKKQNSWQKSQHRTEINSSVEQKNVNKKQTGIKQKRQMDLSEKNVNKNNIRDKSPVPMRFGISEIKIVPVIKK